MNLLALTLAVAPFAAPQEPVDHGDIYRLETLKNDSATYAPNLTGLFAQDLMARLPPADRAAVGTVTLELPLKGEGRQRHPFAFYTRPGRVTVPILSVRFVDDMTLAASWLDYHGCDADRVSDYVGILAVRGPGVFGGATSLLEALGISRERAMSNVRVDDAAQKGLKSALFFIMAHEVGHLRYQHRPAQGRASQDQEMQADRFALDLLRQIGVIPVGIVEWFTMASRWELGNPTTHPLTSQRLLEVADYLRRHARDFASGQLDPQAWVPRVRDLADDIQGIGSLLDDRAMRDYQETRSWTVDPGTLRARCP